MRTTSEPVEGLRQWSASVCAIEAVTAKRKHGGLVIVEGRQGSGRTSILRTIFDKFGGDARYIAVEHWVRDLPLALLARLVEVTVPDLHTELCSELTKVIDGPATIRGTVFLNSCHQVLAGWQESESFVLLVDDLHLADVYSQQLISYLAHRLENTGIVMVVTVPSPAPTVSQDLHELLYNPGNSRVQVTPLDHSAVQRLAESMGIYGLNATAVTALIKHTSGWLEDLVQTLRALPDNRWPSDLASLPLPERIVTGIMKPILQCEQPDVWKLACALAVLDNPPNLQILDKIAETEDLIAAIDTAVALGVLQDGALREAYNTDQLQLHFTHPMAAQVIIRQMLPSEHRSYHQRAAKYLENHGQRLLHRAAAALTRDSVLGGEITRFAARLGRTGRWAQAARFHFAAARLMDSTNQRRTEVLNGLDALAGAGRITEAVPWLPTVEAMSPSSDRESVLAHVALHQGRAADAEHLLDQAHWWATDHEVRSKIALRHCLNKLCSWDAVGLTYWADQAVQLSQPGSSVYVEALAIRGVGLAVQGLTESADQSIVRAGMENHDGPHNQRYRLCAGWAALLEGNLHTAYREFEAALPTQSFGGSLRISLWAQAWLSRIQFMQGDWSGALRGALEGLRRAENAGMELMIPLLEWTAREVQLWRNQEPVESWGQNTRTTTLRGYALMQIPARMSQAVECKVNSDQEGALATLMPLTESDPWREDHASLWHWQPELIQALVVANRVDEAVQLAEEFATVTTGAPRFVQATALASLAQVAGAQKEIAKAEELYQEALRLTSIDGVATYHGRYLFAYGQMLRRSGRRRDASRRLVSAKDFFESVGATVMVERCNRELRATGMVQYRSDDTEIDLVDWKLAQQDSVHLTPQEDAIAQLVVQGLTNRETARQLFIAEKTVQYHLTRIYTKFAIRSRTDLARVYLGTDLPGDESPS